MSILLLPVQEKVSGHTACLLSALSRIGKNHREKWLKKMYSIKYKLHTDSHIYAFEIHNSYILYMYIYMYYTAIHNMWS